MSFPPIDFILVYVHMYVRAVHSASMLSLLPALMKIMKINVYNDEDEDDENKNRNFLVTWSYYLILWYGTGWWMVLVVNASTDLQTAAKSHSLHKTIIGNVRMPVSVTKLLPITGGLLQQ